ncbi:MAG: hypothetical protein IT294_09780 [Deltaproteobacteria bacterium]|nr:hypothetical protein [Deltaproteobacteria bacterium]
MTGLVRVAGDQLSDLLRHPPDAPIAVEVTSAPASWAPLKPLLARFIRSCRERGVDPPVFGGVPLCLFGSEWPGFPSRERTTTAIGRCAPCRARRACGFTAELPDELLAISEGTTLQRWRDYGAAFRQVTGSNDATACTPFVERIMSAYRGPVSLEPSVLLRGAVEPGARFVVFPHRMAPGPGAEAEYREVLACVRSLLAEIGADRCEGVLRALASLPPSPLPVGMERGTGSWILKVYVRLEDKPSVEKQAALEALSPIGARPDSALLSGLQMLGLVLDRGGLHTIKAYVVAQPSRHGADGFPPALAADHPLVTLTGDHALATLDVWCRGAPRASKWDCNVRDHYLAGTCAERLVRQLASPQNAAQLRPLLIGPTYRADVVAVGLRATTVALYMELN